MLTNDQMTANRFARWAKARHKLALITDHLTTGRTVVVSTYTKATKYDARHVAMFKATRTGLYVRRGKAWDCIDGCTVRVYQ